MSEIMALRLDGWTLSEIGNKFAVSRQHIGQRIYADKKRARDAVRRAVRSGRITKPQTCASCGQRSELEAHHEDYSKPLDVKWVCFDCHVRKPVEKQRTPLNVKTRDALKLCGAFNPAIYTARFQANGKAKR